MYISMSQITHTIWSTPYISRGQHLYIPWVHVVHTISLSTPYMYSTPYHPRDMCSPHHTPTGYKMCPTGYNPQDGCCPHHMHGIDTADPYQYVVHGIYLWYPRDPHAIPWTTFYMVWTTSVYPVDNTHFIWCGEHPVDNFCGYIPVYPVDNTHVVHTIW